MTKQEYLICPICAAQTKDYFSTSGNLITDVRCTNRKCFFSSNYVPINTWDRFMHMVERCASLEAENAKLRKSAVTWHKYPDEKPPIDGRYLFWDSDGNAPHVLPYNDIVVRDNPGVFSTQTHWAYLPAPPREKTND